MKNKKLNNQKKTNSKATGNSSELSKAFGGLNVHDLNIEPINVFALKIEHCEEVFPPSCGTPMGPAPSG
jgi:hypothetical protein